MKSKAAVSTKVVYTRLLHDFLSKSANNYPDKIALICQDKQITYEELDQASNSLAALLRKKDIATHDRVIVLLDNSIEVVVSIYGILKNGSIFIILDSSTKAWNLHHVIADSQASLVITDGKRKQIIDEAFSDPGVQSKILWVDEAPEILPALTERSFFWHEMTHVRSRDLPDSIIDVDLASLIYTSGTTGKSKGIMCNHHSMISAASSISQYLGQSPDDIILNVLPLSFDYGLYQVIMSIMTGSTVVIEKKFMFIHNILKCIEKYQVTAFPIVPTIVAMLLNLKDVSKYDFSSLKYFTNTGAAIPMNHIKRLQTLWPHVRFFSMYGLSECKRVCYLEPSEIEKRPGSVGKAMPNCQVQVVDEHSNPVKPGVIGELVVRGSNLMQGYWNDTKLTKKCFKTSKDGRNRTLYSGDYFKQDEDGYLYFISRKDEMIKCKGERVSPKEVENIICQLDHIVEAAVIGIDDPVAGQAIKAYVVVSADYPFSTNEIRKHCAKSLESFKVPSLIEKTDSLPKLANGKTDKKQLNRY